MVIKIANVSPDHRSLCTDAIYMLMNAFTYRAQWIREYSGVFSSVTCKKKGKVVPVLN
jgi:hypothetical protein